MALSAQLMHRGSRSPLAPHTPTMFDPGRPLQATRPTDLSPVCHPFAVQTTKRWCWAPSPSCCHPSCPAASDTSLQQATDQPSFTGVAVCRQRDCMHIYTCMCTSLWCGSGGGVVRYQPMPIPNASYVRGWFLQERHSLVKQIASGAMRNLVPKRLSSGLHELLQLL